jgi:hypothetical protein
LSAFDDAARNRRLDGWFATVYRMPDISQSCRTPSESSFSDYFRTIPKKRGINFADPGQDFNDGESLPFRQWHFGGKGMWVAVVAGEARPVIFASFGLYFPGINSTTLASEIVR